MLETRHGLKVSVNVPYDVAVAHASDALKSQGFGVLTTIDVRQTLKVKLDRDFRWIANMTQPRFSGAFATHLE